MQVTKEQGEAYRRAFTEMWRKAQRQEAERLAQHGIEPREPVPSPLLVETEQPDSR